MKSRFEISQEESQRVRPKIKSEYEQPTKNQKRGSGEIWLGGYCRYRPASDIHTSNFDGDLTEASYQKVKFPTDTMIYSDGFKEKGNIPWLDNTRDTKDNAICSSLLKRASEQYNDGIPFQTFDSLCKVSSFFTNWHYGKKTGREYEFSKAISIWIKRIKGSENMSFELSSNFTFVNSKDYIIITVNDKGKYLIKAICDNGDPQRSEVASGKAKTWQTGGWNEITVKKDEYNNILVYANDELILTYKTPNIPVATRFTEFSLSMPYGWQKNGLQYNIGRISTISYPKSN